MSLFDPATTRALRIPTKGGSELAVEITEGQGPTFVLLCGYNSTMNASKALYLKEQCEAWGYRLIRFNFRCMTDAPDGHNTAWTSTPQFKEQTVTQHVEDALAVLKQLTDSPSIIIGSSMGGWVGMRLLQLVPDTIAGFIGIAAAPDFSTQYDADDEVTLREGHTPIYKAIVQDGRNNMVLDKQLEFTKPVALLQGMQDDAVEWATAHAIAEVISSPDITIHFVKDGEHRLGRPQDMELLWQVVTNMREKIVNAGQTPGAAASA